MKSLVPDTNAAILSNPSKMPCFSFGLPAHASCPRANGSICDSCYASKGFYRMTNVQATQQARFDWTRKAIATDDGLKAWVNTMVDAIRRATAKQAEKLFRIHDSGDFFNARYARAWREVCEQLPEVKFWAPTRAWQLPTSGNADGGLKPFRVLSDSDALFAQLQKLASLPNVTIRPSALNFEDSAPKVTGLHAGSTASDSDMLGHYSCPAPKQGNTCGKCRVCWHSREIAVTYHKH